MTRLPLAFISGLLLSFSVAAEIGPGMGYNDRPPAPLCTHEQESTTGIELVTGGKTAGEVVASVAGKIAPSWFSPGETECLRSKGINLNPSSYTSSDDVSSFYQQCTFEQSNTVRNTVDLEKVSEVVHLQNRDHLMNAFWQDLAVRSSRQIACRVDTLSLASRNPDAKNRLDGKASAKFNAVLDDVRKLILLKRRSRDRNHRQVNSTFTCEGFIQQVFVCDKIADGRADIEISDLDTKIAKALSTVPFAYEADVMDSLIKMAEKGAYDPEIYGQALGKVKGRYQTLNKYYEDRFLINPEYSKNFKSFCVDAEFKKKAAASGVVQKLLASYNEKYLDKTQKAILQCKLNTKYKTVDETKDTVANGAFMVAGVTTAVIAAIPTGGGSVAAFGAAASAGLSVASFTYQAAKAHAACTKKDFVISADGSETCNPEEDFNKEVNSFSTSECLQEIAWAGLEAALVPIDIHQIVRARRGMQITDLVNDASIADEVASLRRTGNSRDAAVNVDGGKDIVVTGKRPKLFINEGREQEILRSLQGKGVNVTGDIPDSVFAKLDPDEKVYILERMGTQAFSAEKGKKLREFFKNHPDGNLTPQEMVDLQNVLAMDLRKLDVAQASEQLAELERNGFVKRAGQAPASENSVVDAASAEGSADRALLAPQSVRGDNLINASAIAARRGNTIEQAVRINTAIPDSAVGLAVRRTLIAEDFPNLTKAQVDALVDDVHAIGAESIRKNGKYSSEDLQQKLRRMRELKVPEKDADALLRLGYTGSSRNLDPSMVRIAQEGGLGSGPALAQRGDELVVSVKNANTPERAREFEAQLITTRRQQGIAYALEAERTGDLRQLQGSINGFAGAGDVASTETMMRAALERNITVAQLRQTTEARISSLEAKKAAGGGNITVDNEILTLRESLKKVGGNAPASAPARTISSEAVTPSAASVPPQNTAPSLNSAQLRGRSEATDIRVRKLRDQIDNSISPSDELLAQYKREALSAADDLAASAKLSNRVEDFEAAARRYADAGDVDKSVELLEKAAIARRSRDQISFKAAAEQVMEENLLRMRQLYKEISPGSRSANSSLTRELELENLREVNRKLAERLNAKDTGWNIKAPTDEPLPTPWAVNRVSPEVAVGRARDFSKAGRHDSAALYYLRGATKRNISDENFTGALNSTLRGSGNLLDEEFKLAQAPGNSAIGPQNLITSLYMKTQWRVASVPAKRKLNELLIKFRDQQGRFGTFSGNTVGRRQLEEMISRTAK